MTRYASEIRIDAPPEAVWDVLTDLARYPDWNPLFPRAEGRLAPGERVAFLIAPVGRTMSATITELDAPRRLVWRAAPLGARLLASEHVFELAPDEAGGTQLRQEESFSGLAGGLLPGSMARKMEAAFREHDAALKARVETGPPTGE